MSKEEFIEQQRNMGEIFAKNQWHNLLNCIRLNIPNEMWDEIPKTMEELGCIFTCSSTTASFNILKDVPGYIPVRVEFFFSESKWNLVDYSIQLGPFAPRFSAKTFTDAVFMSKSIQNVRDKYSREEAFDAAGLAEQTKVM